LHLINALGNSSPHNEKCIRNSLPPGTKAKRDSQAIYPIVEKRVSSELSVKREQNTNNSSFLASLNLLIKVKSTHTLTLEM
jgi:hypothetical protein